ncbi:hypothetical protein O6H91_07G033400 [Diphasiastrum complanatum]|uniref:Uncharacterized protein n=1 Tax=Diphasiastrum complanatum TaxID=34168 RepID=A0ACC2D3V6_DIPCM|nr:hypothetical protein O6H91_07G033400 [Diphasiastrum complanatum]
MIIQPSLSLSPSSSAPSLTPSHSSSHFLANPHTSSAASASGRILFTNNNTRVPHILPLTVVPRPRTSSAVHLAKRWPPLGADSMNHPVFGQSLLAFIGEQDARVEEGLMPVILHLQAACKQIAAVLGSPSGLSSVTQNVEASLEAGSSSTRDVPKPLDIVSNDLLKSALKSSGKVCVIASEEDNLPLWLNDTGPYVVVFDPLDGSRNIDASIPTGTIFGIYRRLEEADNLPTDHKASLNVLQRGSRQIAAGYAIYSSAIVLCLTFGSGTHGFTLDRSSGEFLVSHPNIRIPERGQIYSVNDARYFDWPEGLRNYIDNIRQGKGQNPKKYSARYICSLVADLHRTILYGGIAMNPRDHLRLVYEANPLSFLVEQANGKGSDGKRRILDIQPVGVHQRLPLFLGSKEDVSELESYEDVQQLINPGYEL